MITAVVVTSLAAFVGGLVAVITWCVLTDRDQLDQHLTDLERDDG